MTVATKPHHTCSTPTGAVRLFHYLLVVSSMHGFGSGELSENDGAGAAIAVAETPLNGKCPTAH